MYNSHHITSKLIYITLLLYYNCIIKTEINTKEVATMGPNDGPIELWED